MIRLLVVTRMVPAVREVTGGAASLIAPGRVMPLAAALKKLVTDERSRRALGRQSVLCARQLPTWAESEARFIRAVRKGLRPRPGRTRT